MQTIRFSLLVLVPLSMVLLLLNNCNSTSQSKIDLTGEWFQKGYNPDEDNIFIKMLESSMVVRDHEKIFLKVMGMDGEGTYVFNEEKKLMTIQWLGKTLYATYDIEDGRDRIILQIKKPITFYLGSRSIR